MELEVPIHLEGELSPRLQHMMMDAAELLPEYEVTFRRARPDEQAINIFPERLSLPNPHLILGAELRSIIEPVVNPFPNAEPHKVLYFDIETHNAGKQYGMTPREFFRMGQYAWGIDGEVHITTDYDEMMVALSLAEGIVAHNGHNFDFSVLYGVDSVTPLKMAQEGKLLDTFVWANLAFPAPVKYTSRSGATFYPKKPGDFMRWLSLDNLAFQLGVPGKLGDLKDLAKKHNPPKTKVADYDYGLIPLDDPDFIAYAEQDVKALQGVTRKLCLMSPMSAYDWREQTLTAIDAQNTRNGFMVDVEAVTARRDELAARRDEIRSYLEREYDFPTEGKAPWSSDKGKEVIIRVLNEAGISEDGWPRTPTGALQLGGEVILNLTTGTEAEEIGQALAELKGQRSLSQLTLDSLKEDGKVHPDVTSLQRSGRSCIPETHKLLTRRGLVHVDDIRPGEDETIDMRGNWAVVQEVHRYRNAEVNRYESDTVFLEATEEHRWVQWSETGATRTVETLKPRARLQLAPDAYPFDPFEMNPWPHMTERERRAALVGFLISDGHAANRTDSNVGRGRFVVYQTENKFYSKIREFLGDLVTNDYARPVRNHPDNTIHEMRLKTFEVEAILEEEGLDFQGGLRNSPSLLPWVLGLSRSETEAFLTAVYISDGNVRGGTPQIANLNPNKVEPIQVAAYRMGRRPQYRVYENPVNYQVSGRHSLKRDRVSTRSLPEPETFTADVWCVTTESGTFTAWYPEGRWYGPYLTGNSTTNPGLTVWTARGAGSVEKSYFVPEPGHKLVSFDYSNADARAVAGYSKDEAYRKNFLPGVDNHMNVALAVYGEEVVSEDPKTYRQLAKACVAEGTLVLTDQGEVPIEEITLDHLLWDGESFVKHEGTVYSGMKEVIHYDGITATPDHKVYTTEGLEVPFGVAASRGYTLEVTGDGGRPVSTSHDYFRPGRVALFSECCSEEAESRVHEGRDHSRRTCSCRGAGVSLEARQGKVRVYDIVNVGPHHRFTANGKLVANCSHSWNYGGGASTISRAAGVDADTAQHFVNQMNKAFPRVVQWRNEMAKKGERDGFIKNKWGRKMPVVKDQAYTQSSALMGQSGTREVKGDALLKMLDFDIRLIQWLKAQIHDELLFSIPESEIHWAVPKIKELMYYDWDGVEFYASAGEPADNWELAGH